MSSRVLLINSNLCDQPYPVFPLGLSQVDTALRAAGHTTRLYDCQADNADLETVLADFAPDYVGISCRNIDDIQMVRQKTFFDLPARITRTVRAVCRSPVVLGGSAFSLYPERLLDLAGADYGVQGEGETALVQLLAALAAGRPVHDIPGLVYRDNGAIRVNPRQPMTGPAITAAERDPGLIEYYRRRSSMLNIQTQRGCPLTCCYCTYPVIEGRVPRRREPDAVAAELEQLTRDGVRYVFISDSVFNTTAEHAASVCEAILRRGVKIQWGCFLRPAGIDADLMNLMARAGLSHVEFGSDSFADSVLAEYSKTFTFADILRTSQLAQAARVHQSHFLICGGPGETRETLQLTFENSQRLPAAVIFGLAGMRIYPGTPLQQRALREGLITPETDLLPPVYYISPALGQTELLALLADFQKRASHWIVGELPPFFSEFAAKLRDRGVVGPLWEYFHALQRMG